MRIDSVVRRALTPKGGLRLVPEGLYGLHAGARDRLVGADIYISEAGLFMKWP